MRECLLLPKINKNDSKNNNTCFVVVNSVYHGGYLRDYFLAGCSDFLKKTFDPLPKTSPTFKKKTQLSFGFCSHKKRRYNAIDAQSIYAKLS